MGYSRISLRPLGDDRIYQLPDFARHFSCLLIQWEKMPNRNAETPPPAFPGGSARKNLISTFHLFITKIGTKSIQAKGSFV
jgi:hypothetical protein